MSGRTEATPCPGCGGYARCSAQCICDGCVGHLHPQTRRDIARGLYAPDQVAYLRALRPKEGRR